MREIIGNTTATPNPRPDWAQTDETKADFIKNKPKILTESDVEQIVSGAGSGQGGTIVTVGGQEVARFNADTKADKDYVNELSEFDYVITSAEDFTTEKLATMSGNVLVKDVDIPFTWEGVSITIPESIQLIQFIRCKMTYVDLTGHENCKIVGVVGESFSSQVIYDPLILRNFGTVEDCSGDISIYDCTNVSHSSFINAGWCEKISDCYVDFSETDYEHLDVIAIDNCDLVNNLIVNDQSTNSSETNLTVDFKGCRHLSNIHAMNKHIVITYEDCLYVDAESCDGFVTENENGKVPVLKADGTFEAKSVYSTDEVDGIVGDIGSVLDAILAKQSSVLGGEA